MNGNFSFNLPVNVKCIKTGFTQTIQPKMRCVAEFKDGRLEDITNNPKYKEDIDRLERVFGVDFDKDPKNKLNF